MPWRDAAPSTSDRTGFVRPYLVEGAAGLACLSPYFAFRGESSLLDVFLALSLVAPLFAGYAGSRSGRLDWALAVAAAGRAGLVTCVFTSLGTLAWPAAIWLAAEPVRAAAGAGRRAALPALVVSLTALAMLILAVFFGRLPGTGHAAGVLAAVFLIGGTLLPTRLSPGAKPAAILAEPAGMAETFGRIGEVVTWHDGRGEVLRAAGALRSLLGVGDRDAAGDGFVGRVHVGDRPAFLKALSDAANGQRPVAVNFRFQTGALGERPSETIDLEMTASAERESGGGVRTVTVIRHARPEAQSTGEDGQRSSGPDVNELKGRFLATVSHELRTPLNAIIGFSELLATDQPFLMAEERRREYATIIRDSGHHLLDVVNTLLDVSKIESGNFAFSPEPFSLTHLADGCCDLMQLKADGAKVSLERRLGADLPDIAGDRRACRQILINLVSNAIKFTPAGGRVAVSVTRDLDRLVLSVADTGIGIRESDLSRLGDPFFQAGDVHNRSHEGTGLGLSVVRGLVGLHGGTLVVESGPSLGTSVTVRLPIEAPTVARASRPAVVQTVARVPARMLERKIA